MHDTSIKPITTKVSDKQTARRRNRHNSSVAFVNGGTLKNKLAFSKFFLASFNKIPINLVRTGILFLCL